ncbi:MULTISPECIES: hypothetical protein [Bacillaceae]|uniref:Uncharacterized protein n=1 Tax=Peribacillus huizhouensis TaxID=1501239 RepID=A0ABR6CRH5_9BACI|nr:MULTISPECIES: hypothetical protein [Bacillaceae]MBA9027632.1 hypothetical protein [Peribacillus huizhouensis]
MKKFNFVRSSLLTFLLVITMFVSSSGIVNAEKEDNENNGVPAFGVLKKHYMAWWEANAEEDDFAKEQLEKFNKLNQGEKNKFLKATLSSKTAKDFFNKLNDIESLPENKKIPIGEDGGYLLVTSSIENMNGQKINSLQSVPDGSYYYKYETTVKINDIEVSRYYVTLFATIKDGDITPDNATGGSKNIYPFVSVFDGVSSTFKQNDRAVGNQPFEVRATFFGFYDFNFLSHTVNVYSWIDKDGFAGGWKEVD